MASNEFFFGLTPDRVLDAVEASGLRCTGRCQALNSFENRVYDVELDIEERPTAKYFPINRRVVKFYRPGRWTHEQILEEHDFLLDLKNAEIPVVAPIPFPSGETLKVTPEGGIYYAIFPKVGGRAPDEFDDEQLLRVGRLLARIHGIGKAKQAKFRLKLDPKNYGLSDLKFLIDHDWVPPEYRVRYETSVNRICDISTSWFEATEFQRIHGDCHLGNLLWNESGPFFLDFDDMVRGPTVQDIWLLVPGRDSMALKQRETLIEGYRQMNEFNSADLRLVEPLRALRIVHFSAWIAKRWEDPAFPLAFPEFGSDRYWREETRVLEEQLRLIE